MSGLEERLRRAAAGVGQALGGHRPGVDLVRVDQGVALPTPATPPRLAFPAPAVAPATVGRPKRRRWRPPTSPAERNAPAVDHRRSPPAELHPCPFCGQRHQPIPMEGRGLADLYSRPVVGDPSRPSPLNREADETPLEQGRFRPWSGR